MHLHCTLGLRFGGGGADVIIHHPVHVAKVRVEVGGGADVIIAKVRIEVGGGADVIIG